MEFSESVVAERAREYRRREPLYTVEQEQIDTLPSAFASGTFGWRDAVWVVQWLHRRHLGDAPEEVRRTTEDAFRRNDEDAVRDAIEAATRADDPAAVVDALRALEGVDVGVASAFAMFLDPESFVVVGEREWSVLADAGELPAPYPASPSVAEYERYLAVCRDLTDRFDCSGWTLYRALWRLGATDSPGER